MPAAQGRVKPAAKGLLDATTPVRILCRHLQLELRRAADARIVVNPDGSAGAWHEGSMLDPRPCATKA